MDLRTKAVADTAFLHLRDANDELMFDGGDSKKSVGITLFGPGSKQYARATAAKNNRLMDRMKKKGKSDQTAEESAEENAIFLAQCTAEFHHIERDQLQGEALYKATYGDHQIGFIAEQAARFLSEWGNFSKGSSTN
jgi:hypothetical protein